MNVTKATIQAIQQLVDESFIMTAKIDRMQSVLGVDLAYNNTADLIHHGMAHKYSGYFGDELAEKCLERYNINVEYGDIPRERKSYSTVEEVLVELQDIVIDYQNKLNMGYKIACDNMDIHVGADLMDLIEDHNDYVGQAILLVDKIRIYGDNPSFDSHIKEHFWILGDVDDN